jgi:hypothetical protein
MFQNACFFQMKSYFYSLLIALTCITNSFSQEQTPVKKTKGSLYFSWGYNRDVFSKSDIHLKNTTNEYNPVTGNYDYYDFTIYDATAKDRNGIKDVFRTDLTIPQYVYRIGYYFNNKKDLGIEINFDHVKYVMRDWQTLHVKGNILGQEVDKDTLISPDNFLHFEHTDGANFFMLNIMKRQRLYASKNDKHWISAIFKIGAGPVVPRTDVTIFGQELNNRFHVAGFCAGIEMGLRYDAFKHVFIEYTVKGAYANYINVLVCGSGKGNHHFWTGENILTFGFQFPF